MKNLERGVLIVMISLIGAALTGGSSFGQLAADQDAGRHHARWAEANRFEGQYAGHLQIGHDSEAVELHVRAGAKDAYTATLSFLPPRTQAMRGVAEPATVKLAGTLKDYTLVLTGDMPVRLQYIHGRFTALDDDDNYAGHLTRVLLEPRGMRTGAEVIEP